MSFEVTKRNGIAALLTSASLVAMLPTMAYAQDSQTSQVDEDVEEIVVSGVRMSLENALNKKRSSDSIIDGISSEGIGRFPDLNLADSLSRVTGVQINHAGAGGERREGTVALRGLPGGYARTTVNGQTIATGNFGNGFQYGIFESAVVSGVSVVKSPTAQYDAGGLSGIVDITTRNPLDLDEDFINLKADASYEDSSGGITPNISAAFGKKFMDDKLGIIGTVKYSDQDFRVDSARITSYSSQDNDNDGEADLYIPKDFRVTTRENFGYRLSATGGLGYEFSDTLRASVLGVYSKYAVDQNYDQLRVRNAKSVDVIETTDGGEFGDTATQVHFVNSRVQLDNRAFEDHMQSYAFTGDLVWETEDWKAKALMHYTAGTYTRWNFYVTRRIRENDNNGMKMLLDTGAGNHSDFAIQSLGRDISDPNTWAFGASGPIDATETEAQQTLSTGATDRRENEFATQFDISRKLDASGIRSLDFGVKFRKLSRYNNSPQDDTSGLNYNNLSDLGLLRTSASDGHKGFFGGGLPGVDSYPIPDWQQTYDELLEGVDVSGETFGGIPAAANNTSNEWNSGRNIFAAYGIARFDGESLASALPIRGNVGVRYVYTDRATEANRENEITGGDERLNATVDFGHVLPSVNLFIDVREDLILRLAAYRSLVRPSARSFQVGQEINLGYNDPAETDLETVSISLGNPDLRPFTADAFDASLEWYNREGSAITAAFFYKKVSNGHESRVLCPASLSDIPALSDLNFSSIVTGSLSLSGGQCLDGAGVEYSVTDQINNDDSFSIKGLEFSILQNFDFLPAPWDKFGVQANYTYVDASEGPDFDDSGNRLPLPGVSRDTANLIGYYETDVWGARLAYNYRSQFFVRGSGSFSGEDRYVANTGRLDASFSYHISEQMRLSADLFNITNTKRLEFQAVEERLRDLRHTARTLKVGINYRF